MRDKRFIAEHRGGLLTLAEHRQLMQWAVLCAIHVLPLLNGKVDERLRFAIDTAKDWVNGKVTTGQCMKASLAAHAAARDAATAVEISVSRSIGQCVATAHMSDHSLGAALYALRAVCRAGKDVEKERVFQWKKLQYLPPHIIELVLKTMSEKIVSFKM